MFQQFHRTKLPVSEKAGITVSKHHSGNQLLVIFFFFLTLWGISDPFCLVALTARGSRYAQVEDCHGGFDALEGNICF